MQCSCMEEKTIFLVTGCFVVEHVLCFMDIACTIKIWVYI